jgi:predicted Zn-dependent peptidase
VGAAHTTYTDVGEFRILARAKREHLAEVEALIHDELARMKEEAIPPQELADAQRTLVGRHALAMESNHAHAFALLDYAHLPEAVPIPDYTAAIQAVTVDDIQQVTRATFVPERSFTIVYDPICTANELVAITAVLCLLIVGGRVWRHRRHPRRRAAAPIGHP